MDLQDLVNLHLKKQQELRSEEMFTLGKLISELEKYNEEWIVNIRPFDLKPTCFSSYRGYYSDLSLGYTVEDNESVTIKDLLNMAKECVNKTFVGYKGGDFIMDNSTPIWVSNYGRSSDMTILNIESPFDGYVDINCYQRED